MSEPGDREALVALKMTAEQHDGVEMAGTRAYAEHQLAGVDPHDLIVAVDDGTVVGYVEVRLRHYGGWQRAVTEGTVHPDRRRQGIGTALMHAAGQLALDRQTAPRMFIEMQLRDNLPGAAALAARLGMAPIRPYWWMTHNDLSAAPAPEWPAGIALRPYIEGQDEQELLDLSNEAFADHWGSLPHTMDWLLARQQAPGWRAEDTLLAVDEQGRAAGFCIVLLCAPLGPLAENGVPIADRLGVARAWRRRGLGRALLLAGMGRIRAAGWNRARLHVDAENPTGAARLYADLGFQITTRATAYRRELRSGL